MTNACEPAERLKKVQFSPVRKVLEKANKWQAEGRKIIHMEVRRNLISIRRNPLWPQQWMSWSGRR